MKAVAWHGPGDVRVDSAPEPDLLRPGDAIVRVTSTAICGSDLHLYDGYVPSMSAGDILGHETMGIVEAVGPAVTRIRPGMRVVVSAIISCGSCLYCRGGLWSLCDNSNPGAQALEELYGFASAGLYGYSALFGGYAGGQAEYLRVPFADVGLLEVPEDLTDDQVLFLSDILPTGWMAAANCEIGEGDSVAVFGAGPVGQFAVRSALLLGAGQVIAIDRVPERLALAERAGAVPLDDREDVVESLKLLTGGRGPDACIDAVGMEAHGGGVVGAIDRVRHALRLASDRAAALRTAIQACRKAGVVSVPGVYAGAIDLFPFGALFGKALTLRAGQTHVPGLMRPLLARVVEGELHPEEIVTHHVPLEDAADAYRMFRDKRNGCVKVVLQPSATSAAAA
jgi:threonine dehydrogenase-like Zn-dependent dehydrogenase